MSEDSAAATIATEAEVEAALAEAEAHLGSIPNLDDGRQSVVPVPAWSDSPPTPVKRPAANVAPVAVITPASPAPPAAAERASAAPTSSRPGMLRRLSAPLLSRLRRRPPPAQPVEPTPVEAATDAVAPVDAPVAPRRKLTLGRIIYAVFDGVLAAINWPFGWINSEGRQLLGLLAATTIAVSLLAPRFLPRFFPPRDAVSELHRRVTQVQTGEPPILAGE